MTDRVDLDKLALVVERMMPGPWDEVCGRINGVAGADDDFAGIIALRNAGPALIAELRELRSDRDRLREALVALADACIPIGSNSPTLAAARAALAETKGGGHGQED